MGPRPLYHGPSDGASYYWFRSSLAVVREGEGAQGLENSLTTASPTAEESAWTPRRAEKERSERREAREGGSAKNIRRSRAHERADLAEGPAEGPARERRTTLVIPKVKVEVREAWRTRERSGTSAATNREREEKEDDSVTLRRSGKYHRHGAFYRAAHEARPTRSSVAR